MVGNVLDAYTTWLDLFRLPQCCECLVMFLAAKGLGTAFVIFLLLTENSNRALSLVRLLVTLIAFVVANNAYIYFSRRKCTTTSRRSPGELIQHYLHVPGWLAFIFLIGAYTGLSFLIVWSLGGWKY